MSPAVSILCSARDGAAHLPVLREQLDAVLRPDVEVVLVDDASVDGTGDVFDAWAAELPQVTVVHRERSEGVGVAQRIAVDAARGEYVWLIDCDDRFPADALDVLTGAARAIGADVVVARALPVDETDRPVGDPIDARRGAAKLTGRQALEQLLDGDIEGYTWTKLYRRSLFDESAFDDGAAPPLISTQSDFCRTATAISRSSRVAVIDRVVYHYVRHGASTMDRPDPPLQNLAVARDHLVRLARLHLPHDRAARRRTARFTTWFLAASVIQIPFYVRAGAATRRTGRRIARRAMRTVRVADVLAVDRQLGVEALLLRVSPMLYQLVFRLTHRPTAP